MTARSLFAVVVPLCLAACNKEPPPAAEAPRAANAPAAAAEPASPTEPAVQVSPVEPTPAAAARSSETEFDVSLETKGGFKAGQPGSVEAVLVAKPPFHVNDKYPIKIKLKETPGLKFTNLVVGKDAAKVEEKRAVVPVAFTPERAGKFTIAGQLAFSVCTDEKCLMEKRDLALEVTAE